MHPDPDRPAADVYEVVVHETAGPRSLVRSAIVLVGNLFNSIFGLGDAPANPGGRIITVVERATSHEQFRHIEDMGDDDAQLLGGIRADLASMTVAEFEARWVD